MKYLPEVAVIIPTYNRRHSLSRAVDSVLAQSYQGELEIVVVDDGSTDGTAEFLLSTYPQITLVQQENKGVSSARNYGLNKVNSEWIALLDSDDEWLPAKLVNQLKRLDQSELKVCHTEEIWIRNGVRVNQMRKHQKCEGDIFEQSLDLCAMSPSSIVIHRSIFDEIGHFDESLPACEDYDLWLRICSIHQVALVEEPCIVKYGGHHDQLSAKHWGMDRFRVHTLEKILSQELTSEQRAAVKRVLAKKLTILEQGAVKHGNQELLKKCKQSLDRLAAQN